MTPPSAHVIRCLRSAFGSVADGSTDAALISRFAKARDQEAFELLVWRHAGMVLRVCRSILRDHHAAEDAGQAVFLALARQAAGVSRRGTVAGWLYRVAWRISVKAKRLRFSPVSADLQQIPARGYETAPDPACTEILHEEAVVIIGSQSVLGSFEDEELPPETTMSMEVDVLPVNDPSETKADAVDGAIGEGSAFHETHGFYVQGVGQRTATLPRGWRKRLVKLSNPNTGGRTGLCLERHDLCVAKLVAGREKDHEFCRALIKAGIVDVGTIRGRLSITAVGAEDRSRIGAWLDRTSP